MQVDLESRLFEIVTGDLQHNFWCMDYKLVQLVQLSSVTNRAGGPMDPSPGKMER